MSVTFEEMPAAVQAAIKRTYDDADHLRMHHYADGRVRYTFQSKAGKYASVRRLAPDGTAAGWGLSLREEAAGGTGSR